MSTQNPTAVRVYLARVRSALADLPESEVEEILEDVRPHLAEMEAELGDNARVEALIERLGSPESYAAELRASGGYPPRPADTGDKTTALKAKTGIGGARFAFWGLVFSVGGFALFGFAAAVWVRVEPLLGLLFVAPVLAISVAYVVRKGVAPIAELPEVVKLRETATSFQANRNSRGLTYFRTLKPAWWVLCAAVLVVFGLLLVLRDTEAVLLLPLMLLAAVAVVWAGPRLKADRRLLWLAVPISAFVIGSMLGGAGAAVDLIAKRSYGSGSYGGYPPNYHDTYGNPQLMYGSQSVDNIYAFDGEGKPLTEIYLYDEEGRPLSTTRYACERSTGEKRRVGDDNRYPRPRIERGVQDDEGNLNGYNGYRGYCQEKTDVPFSAAIPKGLPVPPASSAPPSPTSSAAAPPSNSTQPTR
ncbi:DUF1700 domain-containing protein [Amycolatopsis regifaucium]|uniref:Proline-rich protein n=1 Tax=Amycolatopsis regifaucium TaxID=546365 RepID=A0A154MA37_9PSEU|nr:hypothetical protein [Amycolatopsis regifaucium]KZB81396.1 hypothetical protein AVL48_05100 [Amycolatopsis regifaucium]OKA04662.1 hypothetical protein ATP06_0230115 [Amycolatopsis regifaucium]SFH32603.1 Uncharacterized membrane protein [Amycolatopsis regifaucium]